MIGGNPDNIRNAPLKCSLSTTVRLTNLCYSEVKFADFQNPYCRLSCNSSIALQYKLTTVISFLNAMLHRAFILSGL